MTATVATTIPTARRTLADLLNEPVVNKAISCIGRLGIAYLFLVSTFYHLTFGWATTIGEMVARGVPYPAPLLCLAMAAAVTFTLGLVFGIKPRWAALGLGLYVICVSSVIYTPGYSNVAGADTRIFFMKDMAIFGALLMLSAALAHNQRLAARLGQLGAGRA